MAINGQSAASAAETKGRESTTQPSRLGEALLDRIGNTPLLRLEHVTRDFSNVAFYAQAEWFNPGGSVKDRPALGMIRAGLARGALKPGRHLSHATSHPTRMDHDQI